MTLGAFAERIFKRTYALDEHETWEGCARRVAKFVANGDTDLEDKFYDIISERKFIPGGRYLYSAGRDIPAVNNCFMLRADDSREGWADLIAKHMRLLSTGGGVGTYYNDVRPKGSPIKRFGGVASGPVSLMRMVNEVAREVMAGGKRRSALLASLDWTHPDVDEFITAKNWNTDVKAMKERDFNNPAPLDMMNISVWIDPTFIKMLKDKDKQAWAFYMKMVKNMAKTGEPGFLIKQKDDDNEVLTNPCGETRSHLSGDVCNLGAIVLPRIADLTELEYVTRLATEFLYLGSIHGFVADADCAEVRDQSRRIGLGIMGLHEWLLLNGLNYEPNGKLGKWLSVYSSVSDDTAKKVAAKYNGPEPMGRRVVAPTGTTSIIAETTSGIEPVFCTSYKRRYLDGGKWKYVYVIDPTVERLVKNNNLDPDTVEDAYKLAADVERRIAMQAYIQDYVDMAISSTINLPEFGEEGNNNPRKLGETLLKYLPRLRGITMYPDGARSGQPITPVKYETAKKYEDVVYEENEELCKGGVCGV